MKIACLIPGGLGGTQKAGWLFAQGLARLGHKVVGYAGKGPLVPENPENGLSVEIIADERDSFPAIADGGFDALHVHMPGYHIRHPIYPFLKSLGKKRPRVVETNVFGRLQDGRADPVTDFRLFISMASACQAASRRGKPLASLVQCNVARYPVCPEPMIPSEKRKLARQMLGVMDDEVLGLRLGRADPSKWTDFECSVSQNLRQTGSKIFKLLTIEPPPGLRSRIERGDFGPGIITRDEEQQAGHIATLIGASDLIFHCARFGESFGYAIAEGMAAGKPVITLTTPYGDNAQVELVENGITGFVCCSAEGATAALARLVQDPARRESMGAESKNRILALADFESECKILDAAIRDDQPALRARWEEVISFAEQFPKREWNVIEQSHADWIINSPKITAREHAHCSRMKFKKRLGMLRADLRAIIGLPSYK